MSQPSLTPLPDGSEHLLRVLSVMGQGIDVLNRDFEIEFQNELLIERFGDGRGRKCFQVFESREAPCDDCPLIRALDSGEVQRTERQARDGRTYEVSTAPLNDGDGRGRVLQVVRDVTERRRMERALRESEERYRALTEASLVTVAVVQEERFVYMNATGLSLLGLSLDEVLGQEAWKLAHPDDQTLVRELTRGPSTGDPGPSRVEFRVVTQSGETRWLELSIAPILYHGRWAAMGHAVDITERRRAEQALRAAEARYRDLYENATDIIYTHDLDGNFTSVNAAAEKLLGWPREELNRRNLRELVHPESFALAYRTLEYQLLHPAQPAHPIEMQFYDARGELHWLEINSRLIFEQNQPVGVTGIARDITERKRLEAQLRQSQKMEALGQLAGGVAHDFNNLLTGILGYAGLLAQRIPPDKSAEENLSQIERAAERAAALTRQLLAFSRRQQLSSVHLDLNRVVVDVIKLLSRTVGEHIEIRTDLAPDLAAVYADPAQIEQILLNLAVNARDAMPQGGRITISTHTVEFAAPFVISHPWARRGRFVMLAVSDSGVGMTDHVRERAFEPFFTTKPPEKGSGLGLAIVYGIIRQHNGLVHLESELGTGTTFYLYFPAGERPPEELAAEKTGQARGGHETILVAEDEPIVRDLATQILTDSGYEVVAVGDGEQALEALRARPADFDLLILDVVMPKAGGAEVWQAVGSIAPQARVILTSGYAAEYVDPRVGTPGGPAFLAKPFTPLALLRKVREALEPGKLERPGE